MDEVGVAGVDGAVDVVGDAEGGEVGVAAEEDGVGEQAVVQGVVGLGGGEVGLRGGGRFDGGEVVGEHHLQAALVEDRGGQAVGEELVVGGR